MLCIRILAVTVALLNAPWVSAESASTESVKEFMEVTGASALVNQMIGQMLPALRQMQPDAPEEFWVEFQASINPDELINSIVPVYQRHLTQEDVEASIEFFNSKAGKKMIAVQPVIMQESMVIGQQWGQKIAQQVIEKLNKKK